MPTIINAPTPQGSSDPTGLGTGLNGIASAFLDTGKGALTAAALAEAQRKAAGLAALKGQLGNVFAGQNFDPGAAAGASLDAGIQPNTLGGLFSVLGAQAGGIGAPVAERGLYGEGKIGDTVYGKKLTSALDAQKTIATEDVKPLQVVKPDGSLGWATTGDIRTGKVAPGTRPAVGTDIVKGAVSQAFMLPTGVPGAVAPSSDEEDTPTPAGNIPPPGSESMPAGPKPSSDQRVFLGLDSNKETPYNVRYPDPNNPGKFLQRITTDPSGDIKKGLIPATGAALVGTGTQGGFGGFEPDLSQQKNARERALGAGNLASLTKSQYDQAVENPYSLNATGNISRIAQNLTGTISQLGRGFGIQGITPQDGTKLAAQLTAGLTPQQIQTNIDPVLLKNLTDPSVNDIVRGHAMLKAVAAPVLFPNADSTQLYSKHNSGQIDAFLGSPTDWTSNPQNYARNMANLHKIALQTQKQQEAIAGLTPMNQIPAIDYSPATEPPQGSKPFSALSPAGGATLGAATPASASRPPQPILQQGAKQADDGNWYVPNPKGGYLKWVPE